MSHDHSAVAGREPVTGTGRLLLEWSRSDARPLTEFGFLTVREAILGIEAEAMGRCMDMVIPLERSRVRLLMEQGSGDGLEDGSFTLPASVAREIVEP